VLRLFDHPNSSCALRVRFLLAELDLPYRRERVPMTRPRPADYVKLNPLGGIPTLVDGSFVLSESHAILRYLAARAARQDLYPRDLARRAAVDEFLDRFATGLRSQLFRHETPALGYADGAFDAVPRDPQAAARAEVAVQPALRLLEQLVADDGTVLGGGFTIADCSIAPPLYRTTFTGLSLARYPKLTRLRATLSARPAWQRADPAV
jgi:glutathione S-transferase